LRDLRTPETDVCGLTLKGGKEGRPMGEDQLVKGMEVHDVEGRHIGKVVRYEETLGYFETEGAFAGPRYIPFWAIDHFNPKGVFLNIERSVVTDVYQHMPEVTPDLTAQGKLAGTAQIQSGQTGKMVPLDADGVRKVRERIHEGVQVLDAEDESVGEVEAYDGASGYMHIERNGLLDRELYVPVTSVSYLDDEGIHLSDDRKTILARYNRVPDVARPFFGR
jgi:hypothetical protein